MRFVLVFFRGSQEKLLFSTGQLTACELYENRHNISTTIKYSSVEKCISLQMEITKWCFKTAYGYLISNIQWLTGRDQCQTNWSSGGRSHHWTTVVFCHASNIAEADGGYMSNST